MKLEKYLLWTLRIGVFLVFLTPLIYSGSTIFPFIFGKSLYFRGIIEILVALYLILIIAYPKYRPRNSLIFNAVLIYAFVLLLATIFSVDVSRSFWSNHERMMGYFTILHAMAFFVIAAGVFKDREDWKKVFIATTIFSFILNFLGIYQYFQNGTFLHTIGGGQVYSTLGNYIYFGGYCLWHIFIALAYLLRQQVKFSEKLLWITSIFINTIGLVLAGSRGPFLGAFVGVLLAMFLYVIFSKSKKTRLILGAIFLLLIVSSSVIWLNKESNFVQQNRYLARFTDISFVTTTGSTRLLNWGVAWDAFKDRPFLGWGPDNYYIAFNKHYDPRFYEFGQYETWQDHAHNVVLDTLNESGTIGFLSYIFIFLSFYITLFKALKNPENKDMSLIVFPGAAVAAYFVQNLFVFDTLAILMLFYAILSFAHSSFGSSSGGELKIAGEYPPETAAGKTQRKSALADETGESKFWQKTDPVYKNTIIAIILLIASCSVYFLNIAPFRASQMTIRAMSIFYQGDFYGAYNIFKKTLSVKSPYLKETRDEFSKMIFNLANAKTGLPQEELRIYFNEATAELEQTRKEHLKDVYINLYLSQWYFAMASYFQDASYLPKADEAMNSALALSPKRQQVLYMASKMHLVSKNYDVAEKLLLEAARNNSKIGETYWYLGNLYLETGKKDLAYENIIKSINLGGSFAPSPFEYRNSLVLVLEKDAEKEVLDWFFNLSGNKGLAGEDYLNLAKAYKKIANYEKMREAIAFATSTDPAVTKEAEEMLR